MLEYTVGTEGIAQCYRSCLACTKAWIPPSVWHRYDGKGWVFIHNGMWENLECITLSDSHTQRLHPVSLYETIQNRVMETFWTWWWLHNSASMLKAAGSYTSCGWRTHKFYIDKAFFKTKMNKPNLVKSHGRYHLRCQTWLSCLQTSKRLYVPEHVTTPAAGQPFDSDRGAPSSGQEALLSLPCTSGGPMCYYQTFPWTSPPQFSCIPKKLK